MQQWTCRGWQHELGHGPSLHAAANNQTVLIDDMASDWPLFAAEALAVGALSLLSIPLQVSDVAESDR